MNEFNLVVTEAAASQIEHLALQEGENFKLRIAISGGGCSGFKYDYSFVQENSSDDYFFSQGRVQILIDSVSQQFLNNCIIDFVDEIGSSGFVIKNPNAALKCGCGSSFGV